MQDQDFSIVVEVKALPDTVFEKIAAVDQWWAKDFSGSAKALHDRFTIRFKDTFVDFTIAEFISGSKVAWHVTDCNLPFQDNKKEWVDTTVLFELTTKSNDTAI